MPSGAKRLLPLLLYLIMAPLDSHAQQNRVPIGDLIRELSGSADQAVLAASVLSGYLLQSGAIDRLALVPYEKDLIRILETSNNNRVSTAVSLMLSRIDSPEAKAATSARYRRNEEYRAQFAADQKARETTPQTLDQVYGPLRPSRDPTDQLDLLSTDNILDADDSLFVTRHRNENNDELLEIWRKEGDKYRQLKRVSTEGSVTFIESLLVFRFASEKFFLVSVRFPGTGYFHTNYLYHVDPSTHSLADVVIFQASKEFSLPPDEEVMKGEHIEFYDDQISVDFYIWKKNTCNACAIDRVHGNYVIESDGNGGWVMRPGELKRVGL